MTDSTRVVAVPRERLARWLENFAARHGTLTAVLDHDQLVVSAVDGAEAQLPIPHGQLPEELRTATGTQLMSAVVAHVTAERRIAVLLARRRGHAIGIFAGGQLAASKVGSAYVQGRTKAGGWSQQRYARRRANQARNAFSQAADDAAAVLVDGEQAHLTCSTLLCGGDREACESVLADPRLGPVAQLWHPQVVHPVPDPRLRVLQGFLSQGLSLPISLNELA